MPGGFFWSALCNITNSEESVTLCKFAKNPALQPKRFPDQGRANVGPRSRPRRNPPPGPPSRGCLVGLSLQEARGSLGPHRPVSDPESAQVKQASSSDGSQATFRMKFFATANVQGRQKVCLISMQDYLINSMFKANQALPQHPHIWSCHCIGEIP